MFDEIKELWLAWGLYLAVCWEHDLDFNSTELPYDFISNYERSELDGNLRLYGGNIGIFKEYQYNVKMLHEIYLEKRANNTINEISEDDEKNPLYMDIKNGVGTSGINWAVKEEQNGIFNVEELPFIQSLIGSQEGIKIQFSYLNMRIYCYENRISVQRIQEMEISNQSKCLLATFLYWNDLPIFWADDYIQSESLYTVEETANFLLGIFDELDERIIQMYDYIVENLGDI